MGERISVNFTLDSVIIDNLKAEKKRSRIPMSQIVEMALYDYFRGVKK